MRPEHYVVLEAISRGYDTPGKIARALGIGQEEVERTLLSLMVAGLVERVEKGRIFRREAYALTTKGMHELEEERMRVRQLAAKAREEYERTGDPQSAHAVLGEYASFLPMLAMLGMLDLPVLYQADEGPSMEELDMEIDEDAL